MDKQFECITVNKLIDILGLTIKRDEINKLITFLALLSAYTEDSQVNLSFNAPSSSGKSFIPTEIARLFPKEDVIEVAYCSPTAFFHQVGSFDKEKGGYIVDLSRKILIFLDQPHNQLLQHLRPMLSHDKKEILLKITDKNQKSGLRTKNIFLIGYPAVVFCTAGLRIDEQEATRFLLLSPETDQEKIRDSINEKIRKESDKSIYYGLVNTDPERISLIERIVAIKNTQITEIRIGSPTSKLIQQMFVDRIKTYKPRHQRDIGRIINLVKVFALINFWYREQIKGAIYANDEDVIQTYNLWDQVAESQDLNLPPYVYQLYEDVILPAFEEKNKENLSDIKQGLSRQEILQKHNHVYGRYLPEIQLRQQILPMLKISGLIAEEPDDIDKRRLLIYPTLLNTISQEENNSVDDGGVRNTKSSPEIHGQMPCYVCGSTKFWKTKDNSINCAVCHPPIREEDVKEWIELDGKKEKESGGDEKGEES